jgi:hypothetical protein
LSGSAAGVKIPLARKKADMARRVLNRREMRKQSDAADAVKPADGAAEVAEAPAKAPKAKAAPRPRKPSVRKKKEPPRLVARWGVFDSAMKQVAVFNYNQRAQADQKMAELSAKKVNALYFIQIVKEPMPEPAPVEPVA